MGDTIEKNAMGYNQRSFFLKLLSGKSFWTKYRTYFSNQKKKKFQFKPFKLRLYFFSISLRNPWLLTNTRAFHFWPLIPL